MSPETRQLSLEILQQFRIIYGSMRDYFRSVEAACGVSGAQVWLLQEVARSPGIGVSELALRLGVHQSTCSQLVDRLVAREHLVKKKLAHDQRRVGLSLGPAGESALAKLPGPAEGVLPEALSAMPEVALKTLSINLTELVRHLDGRDERYAATPLAEILDA